MRGMGRRAMSGKGWRAMRDMGRRANHARDGSWARVGRIVLVGAALGLSGWGGAAYGGQQPEAAAQRLYLDAQRLEQDGQVEAALRQYALLVQQFPDSHLAGDALLRLSRLHWGRGEAGRAGEVVERLLQEYPRSASAAGAMVLQGEMQVARARSQADLETARTTFGRIPLLYGPQAYPALEWRVQARVRSGELSLLLDDLEQAAAAFVGAVEDEPPSAWTPYARLGLATVSLRQGEWTAAAEILQRVADTSPTEEGPGGAAAMARRRLALIHRLILRPSLGQEPWQEARRLQVAGLQFDRPVGVAATEDGRLLLVDEGTPFVAAVAPGGEVLRRLPIKDVQLPWWGREAGAYAPQEESVVSLLAGERLSFVAPKGDKEEPLKKLRAGERGILGHWLVVDEDRREAMLFSPGLEYLNVVHGGSDGQPMDVAMGPRGYFYILDRRAKAVFRFGPDGRPAGRFAAGDWRRPEALAVDLLGNVYVLDRDDERVAVLGVDGRRWTEVGTRLPGGIELDSPRDVAVDGSGRLYIADRNLRAVVVLE